MNTILIGYAYYTLWLNPNKMIMFF